MRNTIGGIVLAALVSQTGYAECRPSSCCNSAPIDTRPCDRNAYDQPSELNILLTTELVGLREEAAQMRLAGEKHAEALKEAETKLASQDSTIEKLGADILAATKRAEVAEQDAQEAKAALVAAKKSWEGEAEKMSRQLTDTSTKVEKLTSVNAELNDKLTAAKKDEEKKKQQQEEEKKRREEAKAKQDQAKAKQEEEKAKQEQLKSKQEEEAKAVQATENEPPKPNTDTDKPAEDKKPQDAAAPAKDDEPQLTEQK